MRNDVSLYAVTPLGRCVVYVGITNDVRVRARQHRRRWGRNIIFSILDSGLSRVDALRLERRTIISLEDAGFALDNKQYPRVPRTALREHAQRTNKREEASE